MSRDEIVFIYTTLPDPASAERLGEALVGARLAACVNIFPGMIAIYEWQGAIERADETAMFIKTRESLVTEAIAAARAKHPYTTPVFAVLSLAQLNNDYLAWAIAQTGEPRARAADPSSSSKP